MKIIPKRSDSSTHSSRVSQSLTRTKKLAATVAALGAALGMNLQDVLAGPSSASKSSTPSTSKSRAMTASEIGKVKKLQKGSSTLPPSLQKQPDTLSDKIVPKDQLMTRPPAIVDKSSRPVLKNRPDIKSMKMKPGLKNRPDIKSMKMKPGVEKHP